MTDTPTTPTPGDRLAKVMARAGLCSRRDAEEWIKAGRVEVNGRKVLTPAFNVSPTDAVVVDGEPLAERQGTRVWLYHKPKGLVVTEKDPEGRETIFESLEQKGLPRVVSVGRLDINTEGLLLLTNDGGLKRVLELPATGWLRKYRVRAHGTITQAQLDRLKAGIEVDGVNYGPIDATLERDQGSNVWLELSLREGKNREVKNVLGALGLEVNRLIRISFGPFLLGNLPIGAVEVVKARVLKEQLGKRLSDEAEVDFESAMPEESAEARARGPARKSRAPAEERTYGRGTHTATIDKQRFRFTDRAELSPAEAAARRTARPHPKGVCPAQASAPRGGRFERGADAAPPRKIHFDDGREPVAFEEKTYGKKPKAGDRGARDNATGAPRDRGSFDRKPRSEGTTDRPARSAGAGRPFDRKPRADAGARPARAADGGRSSRASAGPRTGFKGKPRAEGDSRPARSFGDKPRGERPSRPPRTEGAEGNTRPFRGTGDAPAGRSFAGKPRASRPFGDKPGGAPRPGGKPRSPRPAGDRPRGARPSGIAADRPRSPRPAGAGDRPRNTRPSGAGRPPRRDGPAPSGGPRRPTRPRGK